MDDIEVNLNKFDDMMKEISDDPVKAITLHDPFKNFILEAKDQLALGLKALANNVGSLSRRLGWAGERDEEDGILDEYENEESYDNYEDEYQADNQEYAFSEGGT